MPSSKPVADAAIVSPYLAHQIAPQGLVPSDNAGRIRNGKGKKPRPKLEANPRSPEEIRFNVGTPRPRLQATHTRGRRTARSGDHHGRRDHLQEDITIPDYPPPSFQEAIRTPIAPTQCTQVITENALSSQTQISAPQPQPRLQERSRTTPAATQSLAVNISDGSDSEISLELVELEPSQTQWEEDRALGVTLEERVKRELRRRVLEDSTPSLSSQERSQNPSEVEGRSRPGRGVLESDSEDGVEAEGDAMPTAAVASKRYLFSLRALSLSPSKASQDCTPSSLPSSSPYSTRSGNAFLKSTTSLYRLPTANSSPSIRGEGSVSRKLFASKGKERLQSEALDSWEVVDSDVPSSPMTPPSKSSVKFAFPVPQRFFERNTPHISLSPFTGSHEQQIPRSPSSPKDQKAFLNRPIRRQAPPSSPSHLVSSTPPSSPTRTKGPAIPSLRIPEPGGNKKKVPSSPLSRDGEDPIQSFSIKRVATFGPERTQEISPPPTPYNVHSNHPIAVSPFGDHQIDQSHMVEMSTSGPVLLPKVRSHKPPREQTTGQADIQTPISLKTAWHDVSRSHPSPAIPVPSRFPLSLVRAHHHYPGRPLPRPPPTPMAPCPEGLLIDFGEGVAESNLVPPMPQLGTQSTPEYPTIPNNVSAASSGNRPSPVIADFADFDPLSASRRSSGSARPVSGILRTPYNHSHTLPLSAGTPLRFRWTCDHDSGDGG